MLKMRHLSATLVAALFPLAVQAASDKGVTVRGEAVSPADIAALPPVCKLIMENPGIHHPTGQKRNAQLFDRPEYHMAKDNNHLHHYCWALISKQRYFREPRETKRNYYFDRYLGDINYVFEHSAKTWGYFDVLHVEIASMYVIRGDYAKAISHADQAIAAKPVSEKAYVVKTDAYKQMGKKERAVETALEGLKKNPRSKVLRKRLSQMGVKPPAAEEIQEPKPVASAAGSGTASDSDGVNASAPPETAVGTDPSAASDKSSPPPDTATTTTSESSRPNPYCRFCP